METSLADRVVRIVQDELEPNASFICQGDDDSFLYWVQPEVLEALVWIATKMVVPMLTGVATAVVTERMRRKDSGEEMIAMRLQREELEALKAEVRSAISQIEEQQGNPAKHSDLVHVGLARVLSINGWPSDFADESAARIVSKLIATKKGP